MVIHYSTTSHSFSSLNNGNNSTKSFEFIDLAMVGSNPIRLITIYRPPPSSSKGLTCELFFTEFRSFLEEINNEPGHLIITGDFNFHIETNSNSNSKKFMELINIFNLKQHVQQPTHVDNHTLDLIITRNDSNIVHSVYVRDPGISLKSAWRNLAFPRRKSSIETSKA